MLKIRIETKNAAFEDDLEGELIRCLKDVIDLISKNWAMSRIHDINGNIVGEWKLTNYKSKERRK